MRIFLLFFLIILFISCEQNISHDKSISPTPSDFEISQKAEKDKQSLKDFLAVKEIEDKKKINQELRQALKNTIAAWSKTCQLPNLENQKVSEDDLEVRVWQHSGWWDLDVFVLSRIKGNWAANLKKLTFKEGTDKLKKISKLKLEEPNSGWETFWKKIVNEEILTLQDGFENEGSEPCPDCGSIIVETKVEGNYRWYVYTAPSLKSPLRERRQVAKIANVIAQEFRVEEFRTIDANE